MKRNFPVSAVPVQMQMMKFSFPTENRTYRSPDILRKLLIRSLSDKGTGGFTQNPDRSVEDHQGNNPRKQGIDPDKRTAEDNSGKNNDRGYRIAPMVPSISLDRTVFRFFCGPESEAGEQLLDHNG